MDNRKLAAWTAVAATALVVADRLRARRKHDVLYQVEDALDREINLHLPAATAALGVVALAAGGLYLSNVLRASPGSRRMSNVQESIELDVPVRTAYNQWTQFEEFPKFMATVQEVRQVDDTHLHWKAIVGGKVTEWDAEITEQVPDERIAWRSTTGPANAGVVTFHRMGDNRTRVMLQMDYEPQTLVEKVGDAVGGVKLTAKGNLKKFKALVEERGTETGAWRGTVPAH